MNCQKCKKAAPEGAAYCPYCGMKFIQGERRPKTRGNGTGSVYKLQNGRWIAVVTLGYKIGEDEKLHRVTRSRCFARKVDAVNALPELKREAPRELPTLGELYERWLPTHQASKSTLDCYKAAWRYFDELSFVRLDAITIDDLQECISECGHGRRTQENMRTALGLAYKYGIPRHLVP